MTKLQLLEKVSEADIFAKYIPGYTAGSTRNFKSPFVKDDKKPSLSIYQDNGHLKFKSHNSGHQGDVFQFVADLKGIDNKRNFDAVIEAIAKDFSINGFSPASDGKKKSIKISFEPDPQEMYQYFKQFKISKETLLSFGVNQVKYHEFTSAAGKVCKFDYRRLKQLAICYKIGERIKVYFPSIEGKQDKIFGFKDQTNADIFALSQIGKKADRLFLAAGEKDCLALNSNGFPSIALQSENTIPTSAQVRDIKAISPKCFIVYDNDEAGQKAAKKLSNLMEIPFIELPTGFKDIAEFFAQKTAEDFEELIKAVPLVRGPEEPAPAERQPEDHFTIFHQAEKYLSKHYDLRYNSIKLELEVSEKGKNIFGSLNENDLFVELNKQGVKIGMDKLIAILKSSFVQKFNPVQEYFLSLPPHDEQSDYIKDLASHLRCENPQELYVAFLKWMVRAVRTVMEPGYFNKQAFILVHSKQNSGKSSFCRFLVPPALREYVCENITDDKDSRIALAKNFLINLDELSSLAKHEINSLKSLFSKDIINERLPYDRKNSIIPRVASFIGSTNMAEFLADETGSVRWLCFEIKSIDWTYRQTVDINKVWALAYGLYKDGLECDMTREEIEENERRNAKFQQLSTEAEIIPNYFRPGSPEEQEAVFMTATDIMVYLSQRTTVRLNKISIGKAMGFCGFKRAKEAHSDRYGYWAIELQGRTAISTPKTPNPF